MGTATGFPAAETPNMADKSHPDSDCFDALDNVMIAALSARQISEMTRAELIRVVERTCLPQTAAQCKAHLAFAERPTLERLVYLARRYCRNLGY
ncbi:MAG: hypothetical protein HOL01_01115 [Planctomycetaceae bacterium]|nr:hypothetical protein [Planctomycetaceae bacterium]